MPLTLYNTRTRREEAFTPRVGQSEIGMYVCGPTVYDRAHIGNARPVVVYDLLYRLLKHLYEPGLTVRYVRNITDIDDKINAAAKARGVPIHTVTEETTRYFHEDMAALGVLPPNAEPRATEHLREMAAMIGTLLERGIAYEAEGHVLFDVTAFPEYGALSGRALEDMQAGARVEIAPYKRGPMDFVLWKPSAEDEPGWDNAALGLDESWLVARGRPGWHIECSAMSTAHLGDTFDIHGGGRDLIFPHHENEVAQACGAHPQSAYARYWVHNGFLTVEGQKMSKSLGNFFTVHDLLEEGAHGMALRLLLLSTHYRKPLDFTRSGLTEARKTLDYFYEALAAHRENLPSAKTPPDETFTAALCRDLNTPEALARLHELARAAHSGQKEAAASLLSSGRLMGLFTGEDGQRLMGPEEWFAGGEADDPGRQEAETLAAARVDAKAQKDYAEADRLRAAIVDAGFDIRDLPGNGWELRAR